MKDLIEALQILLKYGNVIYPFVCEHDTLHVVGYNPEVISTEDRLMLKQLGFIIIIAGEVDEDNEDEIIEESKIYSYRYGSA